VFVTEFTWPIFVLINMLEVDTVVACNSLIGLFCALRHIGLRSCRKIQKEEEKTHNMSARAFDKTQHSL